MDVLNYKHLKKNFLELLLQVYDNYILWKLKENNLKFKYLYPHFDESFKSTNPRINENSKDIGIHMWYTRQYTSDMDVHGLPNNYRYRLIEEYLKAI